jgi:hypothetical protein
LFPLTKSTTFLETSKCWRFFTTDSYQNYNKFEKTQFHSLELENFSWTWYRPFIIITLSSCCCFECCECCCECCEFCECYECCLFKINIVIVILECFEIPSFGLYGDYVLNFRFALNVLEKCKTHEKFAQFLSVCLNIIDRFFYRFIFSFQSNQSYKHLFRRIDLFNLIRFVSLSSLFSGKWEVIIWNEYKSVISCSSQSFVVLCHSNWGKSLLHIIYLCWVCFLLNWMSLLEW